MFITEGVDIESNFINSAHINSLYPEIIDQIIEEATEESRRDSLDRLLKKFALQKKSGIEFIDNYDNNKARYRYGKKVYGLVKSKIQ